MSQGHQKAVTGDVVTGDSVTTQIVREIILPAIEREVNEGQNFAPLRQIYHSLILAKWYKETIKNNLLSKIYIDQKKIAGVNIDDATLKDQIYAQYMAAYKKGVFNYIKEDYDQLSQTPIPRKYFSGGIDRLMNFETITLNRVTNPNVVESGRVGRNFNLVLGITPQKQGASSPISREDVINLIRKKISTALSYYIPTEKEINDALEILSEGYDFNVIFYGARYSYYGDTLEYYVNTSESGREQTDLVIGYYYNGASAYMLRKDIKTYPDRVEIIRGEKLGSSSSPVSMNDLLSVPAGLIGALEENGQILSIKAGEMFNVGFGDYWNQIVRFGSENPEIITIAGAIAGLASAGGLYYFWSRYTVSGNLYRLRSFDSDARESAAEALGELGDTRAVPALLERLTDPSSSVRISVVRALGELGDTNTVPPLIKQLANLNSRVRHNVAGVLGKLGDPRAVPPLIERLADSDFDVYESAAKALEKLGASNEQMLSGYIKALGSSSSRHVRISVVEALEKLGDIRAIPPLIERLADFDSGVRQSAAEVLEKLGASKEQIINGYLMALGSLNDDARRSAAKDLEKLDASKEQMVNGYLNALESPSSSARAGAAKALGKLEDKKAVEPLIARLGDSEPDVRGSAAEALGKLGDARAVPSLVERLADSYSGVRMNAAGALGKLGDKKAVEPLIALLDYSISSVRAGAAKALGKLKDKKAFEPLIARLGDSGPDVRGSAAEALHELGANKEQMIDGHIKALGSFHSHARWATASVLGELGDKKAVEPLIARLGDSEPDVRGSAAEALGKLGDVRAIEPLKVLLTSTSKTIETTEYGPYGDSWTNTYDNPEYSAIEKALQKLRAGPRDTSSSPLESRELSKSFVDKILATKKVDLADIKDERLKKFLIFLKENNLTDIVVMGGAIKSILFNEEVADIDISVKTVLTDEERAAFAPLAAAANERVYKNSLESITRLAKTMGIDASAFLPPAHGITKAFEGLNIDYFGPLQTDRGTVIKRSIFDAVTRKGYFTNTEADLLRFAIDADGNIYGNVDSLKDLLQGKLTIQGDGTNFGINDVLRVLRLKHQYGLQISNKDYQLLKNAVSRYKNQSIPPIVLEVAQDQIQKLLASAVNKESAQQELEALGISSLIDKSRSTPQSSSPVSSKDEVGGIDMNSIDLEKQGGGVDIQFDPAELQEIIDAGIEGFAPVIINITPLPSVLPLLGLEPQRKEDELEVSSLN